MPSAGRRPPSASRLGTETTLWCRDDDSCAGNSDPMDERATTRNHQRGRVCAMLILMIANHLRTGVDDQRPICARRYEVQRSCPHRRRGPVMQSPSFGRASRTPTSLISATGAREDKEEKNPPHSQSWWTRDNTRDVDLVVLVNGRPVPRRVTRPRCRGARSVRGRGSLQMVRSDREGSEALNPHFGGCGGEETLFQTRQEALHRTAGPS